nr:929_t:CDS:2 [Entrophospora candida]
MFEDSNASFVIIFWLTIDNSYSGSDSTVDVTIEKFVRKVLENHFKNDKQYKEREEWEQIWYKLRTISLELFRTIRGNSIRRIKSKLFQTFPNLEQINNDASVSQILEWKGKDSTKIVLESLCQVEDDNRTFLENIQKMLFW